MGTRYQAFNALRSCLTDTGTAKTLYPVPVTMAWHGNVGHGGGGHGNTVVQVFKLQGWVKAQYVPCFFFRPVLGHRLNVPIHLASARVNHPTSVQYSLIKL